MGVSILSWTEMGERGLEGEGENGGEILGGEDMGRGCSQDVK